VSDTTASLLDLTPAKVWGLISSPSQIPAKLRRPPASTVDDVLLRLDPTARPEQLESYRLDYLRNHEFFAELNDKMVVHRHRRVRDSYEELVYVLTRHFRPEIVVETGVFDGQSTAAFLLAMHDNQRGTLFSIDLPAFEPIQGSTHRMLESALPPGCEPGWVIPDYLRNRHELLLGDSKQLLPQTLEKCREVDFFIHDSLHTLEHQLFEYRAAWPYIREGGLLLSDDIHWNAAFHRFSKEVGRPYQRSMGVGVCAKAANGRATVPARLTEE